MSGLEAIPVLRENCAHRECGHQDVRAAIGRGKTPNCLLKVIKRLCLIYYQTANGRRSCDMSGEGQNRHPDIIAADDLDAIAREASARSPAP